MPATKTYHNLNAALDSLDDADLTATIDEATDALAIAASVETMADLQANLNDAATALRKALACVERLAARCPAGVRKEA